MSSSIPKVLNVPLPYTVLSMGVPVKPMIGGIGQARHEKIAQIAARGAMGLIDEDVDVGPGIDVGRHVAEFVEW